MRSDRAARSDPVRPFPSSFRRNPPLLEAFRNCSAFSIVPFPPAWRRLSGFPHLSDSRHSGLPADRPPSWHNLGRVSELLQRDFHPTPGTSLEVGVREAIGNKPD